MRYKAASLVIVMLVALAAMPSSVSDETHAQPPSCIDVEIKRAQAEAKLAAQNAFIEACNLHLDELKKQNARLKRSSESSERNIASVRNLSTELSSYYEKSKRQVTILEESGNDKDAAISKARAERDVARESLKNALERIRRTDRANLCRALKIGCASKKPE